jgi:hypothetical protein
MFARSFVRSSTRLIFRSRRVRSFDCSLGLGFKLFVAPCVRACCAGTLGWELDDESYRSLVASTKSALLNYFRPEFLERPDDVCVFLPLQCVRRCMCRRVPHAIVP